MGNKSLFKNKRQHYIINLPLPKLIPALLLHLQKDLGWWLATVTTSSIVETINSQLYFSKSYHIHMSTSDVHLVFIN